VGAAEFIHVPATGRNHHNINQIGKSTLPDSINGRLNCGKSSLGEAFFEFRDLAIERAAGGQRPVHRDIFLSRKARRKDKPDFRYWINEDEVERSLISRGFTSLAPETLPLPTQIDTFRNAQIVVGELSSALHNTIFCPARTSIVQINPFNGVQKRLSLSLGHQLISIIPDSGKLAAWPPTEGEQEFSVDVTKVLDAIDLIRHD
jgi:hypothetical protein